MDKPTHENEGQKTLEEIVQKEQLSQDIPTSDLNFLIDSKEAMLIRKTPYANAMLYITAGIVLTFIIWASFSSVDEVVKAPCKIVSTESKKIITNQNAGKLEQIFIKEGDTVDKGEVIAKLDPTAYEAAVKDSQDKIDKLEAQSILLQAQARGAKELVFSDSFKNKNAATQALVQEKMNAFAQSQKTINEALAYKTQQLENLKKDLADKELGKASGLYNDQAVREVEQKISVTQGEIADIINKPAEAAGRELSTVNKDLDSERQKLVMAQNNLEGTELKAPVDGKMNQVDNVSVGSFIPATTKLFEITPTSGSGVFECKTPVKDKAFIHAACTAGGKLPCNNPGQLDTYEGDKAVLMVDTFPFPIYGSLEGHVQRVNTGVTEAKDDKTPAYFETIIKPDKNYLTYRGVEHPIVLDTTAQANIIVGKKTVMAYLMKPFTKASYNALTER